MVTIELQPGQQASIEDGEWTADDPQLADRLNRIRDPMGASGSDPRPDLTTARNAVELFGGKVVSEGEPDPGDDSEPVESDPDPDAGRQPNGPTGMAADDPDGHWITIDGSHVFIKGGVITKGPAALRGKNPDHITGEKSPSRPTRIKRALADHASTETAGIHDVQASAGDVDRAMAAEGLRKLEPGTPEHAGHAVQQRNGKPVHQYKDDRTGKIHLVSPQQDGGTPSAGAGGGPAPSPASSATRSAGQFSQHPHDAPEMANLKKQSAEFPAGPRRDEAQEAASPSRHDTVFTKHEGGNLKAIASAWTTPDAGESEGMPAGQYIKVRNLATSEPGHGRAMMKEIAKHAARQGAGVYLSSLSAGETQDFYKKMGMQQGLGLTYYLTKEQTAKLASAGDGPAPSPSPASSAAAPNAPPGQSRMAGSTAEPKSRYGHPHDYSGLDDSHKTEIFRGVNSVTESHGLKDFGRIVPLGSDDDAAFRGGVTGLQFNAKAAREIASGHSSDTAAQHQHIRQMALENLPGKIQEAEQKLSGIGNKRSKEYKAAREDLEYKKDILDQHQHSKRGLAYEIANGPARLEMAAAHEAAHHAYERKNLQPVWRTALIANNVKRSDLQNVSDYTMDSSSEAFAEVAAMYHTGRADQLPANVRRSYEATIGAGKDLLED